MRSLFLFDTSLLGRRLAAVGCIVLVFSVAGCGGSGRRSVDVTGTVTIDGAPVQMGQVDFEITEDGDLPSGAPISNGVYRLKSTPGRKKVRVTAIDPASLPTGSNDTAKLDAKGPPMAKSLVPEKYLKEPLVIEIGSSGVYDISLTSN